MKRVNEEGRALCRLQGEIFEVSPEVSPSGSAVFVRRYMYSAVAARMDRCTGNTETGTAAALVEEVEREYGGRPYGKERFAAEELYWMGYLYRFWALERGMRSKELVKIIGANELRGLYFPYHTMDAEQAVERILEAKGLKVCDELERGVALMRRARAQTEERKKRS